MCSRGECFLKENLEECGGYHIRLTKCQLLEYLLISRFKLSFNVP